MTLLLSNLKFFQACDEDRLKLFEAQSHIATFQKGQVLFFNDDEAKRFYFIQNGWIKLYRETLDGSQAIIDILTNGHMFGETALFHEDHYPYSAEAAEPTTLISLPLPLLKTEIETNPKIAMSMMASMARYRKQQDQELENRTLKNAPQRIGCFLLRLVDQDISGAVTIHLPYDKTLVASRLGMQPETFSRALNKLRDETNITIKGATIEVANINDLVGYACSACSSEFPCKDIANY